MDENEKIVPGPPSDGETPDTGAAAPQEPGTDARRECYDWLQSVVSALLVCVLVFTFLVRIVSVIGSSMVPTLEWYDKIIISDLFFEPEYGDVVVLLEAEFRDEPLVKRVIATAGQTVDIDFDRGVVSVDGVELEEDYTASLTFEPIDFKEAVTVPEGCVFVMGDNRNHSSDSRDDRIGCIDERLILGKVYFVLFPGTGEDRGAKRDFSRIGSVY